VKIFTTQSHINYYQHTYIFCFRFDVSKGRINSLQQFRRKRGQFFTLDDVLEVDGLGVKVLEKLCDSILNDIYGSEVENSVDDPQVRKQLKSSKDYRRQILTPPLHFNQKMVRV
jgi:hypothetical protein